MDIDNAPTHATPNIPIVGGADSPPNVLLPIEGAVGQVALVNWRSQSPYIAVDGKRAGRGSTYKIPLANGQTAKAKVKALIPGAPRVIVDGVEVFTTPQPPVWLVVLAASPALSLIALRGILGLVLALGGVALAVLIARRDSWPTGRRALVIAGVALATWILALAIGVGLVAAAS
jgi:hypothetical protein